MAVYMKMVKQNLGNGCYITGVWTNCQRAVSIQKAMGW